MPFCSVLYRRCHRPAARTRCPSIVRQKFSVAVGGRGAERGAWLPPTWPEGATAGRYALCSPYPTTSKLWWAARGYVSCGKFVPPFGGCGCGVRVMHAASPFFFLLPVPDMSTISSSGRHVYRGGGLVRLPSRLILPPDDLGGRAWVVACQASAAGVLPPGDATCRTAFRCHTCRLRVAILGAGTNVSSTTSPAPASLWVLR